MTAWEKVIANEINHQNMQRDFFMRREKVGDIVRPKIYQPKMEPAESAVVVIFVEPGAVHLVFRDEIAPQVELDERYREVRQQLYGRVHDIESVEFPKPQWVKFFNNYSFFNIYEVSYHWTSEESYKGAIFSDTWNHMCSAGGNWVNILRGGYKEADVEFREGDREAAERWQPEVQNG